MNRRLSKISLEMDKKTAKVVRCKSSNTAIVTRGKKRENKKSLSSGEFDTFESKKRGVYVEKKMSRLNPAVTKGSKKEIKAPPRPPPGKKMFLDSVLSILAKSTAATQYPASDDDLNDPKKTEGGLKNKKIKRKSSIKGKLSLNPKITPQTEVKKSKFKSKILNEIVNTKSKNIPLITVLQSKGGVMSPSNYSGRSKEFYAGNESSDYAITEIVDKTLETGSHSNTTEDLLKEVLGGKSQRKAKLKALEEPTTLISTEETEKQKYFYNFFVDLLKTTVSVHKLQSPRDKTSEAGSVEMSKINLHIDESVAKRLNVQAAGKSTELIDSVSQKAFQPINASEYKQWNEQDLYNNSYTPHSFKRSRTEIRLKLPQLERTPRRKTRSSHNPKKNTILQNCAIIGKKGSFYRNKKVSLLKMFKEELKMDAGIYEEPQNFYEALKVMAQSKRRKRKIHFDESTKKSQDDKPCRYKFRQVLASRRNYKPKSTFFKSSAGYITTPTRSEVTNYSKITPTVHNDTGYPSDYPSYHSLEVYGFDYVDSVQKLPERPNEFSLPYHVSTSESELSEF